MTTFTIPDFTLPQVLKRLGPRLPQLPPTLVLVGALNAAMSKRLGNLLPRDLLEPMIGKRVTIRVLDAGMTLRFAYGERGFRPSFETTPADLTMSARSRDFLALLLREEDPDTLFFSRRLLMEGDTDLGLLVKNTLDGIDLPRLDPAQLVARLSPAELLNRFVARLAQRAVPHH
ncbi:MAG: SCP2 sterol-binding domain-containing protein [Gammaproteobacteria bacterium]|nr:SCP2 sterol-binding domain-containing protein [Gammaproteobacteria bacterium]MBU1644954.1 SCP2 sterol-binding domain-containing protein [Gammaproteobacteria bacterium]MBU1971413.1 SCP2 sterol-binding domain-containing protein [Gammaproteobacteria bacterium]